MSVQAFTVAGVVHQGTVRILDRNALLYWAQGVGDGTELVIEIKEKKETRSSAQNRALWGPIYDQILEQVMCGDYRADEAQAPLDLSDTPKKISEAKNLVHYGLLAARFGYVIDPITKKQVPARTSSELNTQDMAEYFKWLQVYCADELHIQIDLPDELEAKR